MLVLAERFHQAKEFSKYAQRIYVAWILQDLLVRYETDLRLGSQDSVYLERLVGQATILSEPLPLAGCASDRLISLDFAQSIQGIARHSFSYVL